MLDFCTCADIFTIEPHGDVHVLYYGRCRHRHGYNLCAVSDVSANCLDVLNASGADPVSDEQITEGQIQDVAFCFSKRGLTLSRDMAIEIINAVYGVEGEK